MGGTTKLSGWALFCFLSGFTILGTTRVGGGFLSLVIGLAVIVLSSVLFKAARAKEEV